MPKFPGPSKATLWPPLNKDGFSGLCGSRREEGEGRGGGDHPWRPHPRSKGMESPIIREKDWPWICLKSAFKKSCLALNIYIWRGIWLSNSPLLFQALKRGEREEGRRRGKDILLYTTAGGERGEGILNPPPPLASTKGWGGLFFESGGRRGGHWIVEEEKEDGRGCMSLAVVHKKGFFVPSPLLWGIVCRRGGHNTGNLAGYLWAVCVCVWMCVGAAAFTLQSRVFVGPTR